MKIHEEKRNKKMTKKEAISIARKTITGPHLLDRCLGKRYGIAVDGKIIDFDKGRFPEVRERLRLRRIDHARKLMGKPGVWETRNASGDWTGSLEHEV